jgi:RNA polymerase sigma factor (sigma-70 family)
MDQHDWLAEQFEANRPHLRSVAYRMLGSLTEADDAVQEAWLHLSRAETSGVKSLGGWLTTVVARVCLDMLRSRESRREESLGEHLPEPIARREDGIDPEHEAVTADSVGLALLVVLETLAPAERLAFVLHDLFGVPFDETPSWPLRAAATSRAFWRCSTQMSCFAPMAQRSRPAWRATLAHQRYWPSRGVQPRWPGSSRGRAIAHNWRSSMEPPAARGLRADGRGRRSPLRSRTGRLSQSRWSSIPSGFASST